MSQINPELDSVAGVGQQRLKIKRVLIVIDRAHVSDRHWKSLQSALAQMAILAVPLPVTSLPGEPYRIHGLDELEPGQLAEIKQAIADRARVEADALPKIVTPN
jgi:hypothetical protein